MRTTVVLAVALLALRPGLSAQESPGTSRLSIDEAVAEALARNLTMQTERARLPLADALRMTAGLRPNPVLSFSSDHLDLAGYGFTEENGGGPAEFSVRTDYLWEQAGKRRRRQDVADREGTVMRHQVADAARLLAYEVRSAFIDLQLAQQTIALAQENLTAMQRVEQVSGARVRSGDLAEVEAMRTRVAVRQIENEVRLRELARRTAQRRLNLLMGRPADAGAIDAAGAFEPAGAPVPPESDVERAALASRPDLQALIADGARSEADLLLQRSIGRVDFTLGTEFRRQQGLNGRSNSLGFFASTPLPVFDRNQGEVARARVDVNLAARRVEVLRASIAHEVREAYDHHQTARALLEQIENKMLTDAREVRSITEYAYQRGEASLVELLDAQRAFNETMESHLGAQAECARSRYLIDAVSGKGDYR